MVPIVVTIAGSDSSGGAGIQADLKAIAASGGYGATVITAITAQNSLGVLDADPVSIPLIQAQIEAVFDDLDVAACKTGMLADEVVIRAVADAIRDRRPPWLICDPVMNAKTGFALLKESAVSALTREIVSIADVVTPNVHEARVLSGIDEIVTVAHAVEAGRRILEHGSKAVLVTGGRLEGAPATDVLVTPDGDRVFEGEHVETTHVHGTGCTYASAIATHLALGRTLEDAVAAAKRFVTEAIRHGLAIGRGSGPVDPFFPLRTAQS